MLFSLFLCLIGFVILSYAADKLVEGASNLALNLGVSKTVIGLTVVAAGTSLPEMVVSVNASMKGNPSLSLGNLVGSNIMNAALILGIASLICPISCSKAIVKREVPIMIGTAGLLWYMAHTGKVITPAEGLVLFAILIAYTGLSYYWSRQETAIAEEIASKVDESGAGNESESEETLPTSTNVLYLVGGLIGLVIGSETLVKGAVDIAQSFGVSDEVIGLTLIAIGTSLPELATSVVAARKGQSEITLGNVVGSNIFNVLGIVGCASAVSYFNATPETQVLPVSPEMLGLHIPLMFVVSLGVLPIMRTGLRIVRLEGAFLVGVYIAYNVMLFQTTARSLQPVADPLPGNLKEMSAPLVPASDTINITPQQNDQSLTSPASSAIEIIQPPTVENTASPESASPASESLETIEMPPADENPAASTSNNIETTEENYFDREALPSEP